MYFLIQSDIADVGWSYLNGEFIKPSQKTALLTNEQLFEARTTHDLLITKTDYLLILDYPITAAKLSTVKLYRQSLRDITNQSGFPTTIEWPSMPL